MAAVAAVVGAIVHHGDYAMLVSAEPWLDRYRWLLDRAEAFVCDGGGSSIEISVWDDDREVLAAIGERGYPPAGSYGRELVNDRVTGSVRPRLPDGFQLRWLEPELDVAYVELHRAAWSDRGPSTYVRSLHDAVTAMPDFDRRLVPIVVAPDGTLAAYCISWFDRRTRTVEIEPLGTRPEYRRLGLGRAIVDEAVRRSAERDPTAVMVWNIGTNAVAGHLYTSAGFASRRVLREYRRTL